MKNLFTIILLATALTGCAFTATKSEALATTSQALGMTPQSQRITAEAILGDRNTIDAFQQRLKKLSEAGIAQNNYSLAKAQCWLDTAKAQYHENDRTGYVEESLAESSKIIQALENNKNAKVGFETPLIAGSLREREDLWAKFTALKGQDNTLACNARSVACGEVRLVRAGHAHEQTGWRAAAPHIAMAEDASTKAASEAATCPQPAAHLVARTASASVAPIVVATSVTPMSVSAPVAASVAAPVVKESFVLISDALFQFNKSSLGDLLPGGHENLKRMAERLKGYKSIQTLNIYGHTDRLGSEAYNDALSQNRAQTVRAYLESLGVKADNTNAQGRGTRESTGLACSAKLAQAALVTCLQPDRRVTLEVTGVLK